MDTDYLTAVKAKYASMRRASSSRTSKLDSPSGLSPTLPTIPHRSGDDAREDDEDDDDDDLGTGLPLPVQAAAPPASAPAAPRSVKKSARIDGARGGGKGLRVHWARFRKRIGTGTAPSTSELTESAYTGGSSVLLARRNSAGGEPAGAEGRGVDEVVVDRSWFDEIKSSVVSQSEGELGPKERGSANGGAAGASASVNGNGAHGGTNTTDRDSGMLQPQGFWAWNMALVMVRYRLWPAVVDFFSLRFYDEHSENHYRKETWFLQKSLAIWSSLFLILNWVLTIATLPRPLNIADRIFFYGISGPLTFMIFPMVMYDLPRDRPAIYQIAVTVSVWSWTFNNLFSIYFCGFYTKHLSPVPYPIVINCGPKDFLGTLFFATALPTIALFGLRLKRFPQLIGTLVYFVVGCVLILRWKSTWYRNLIQTAAYHCFLLWVHYMRENAERRLYVLRDQLKMQYKATQKAQINERKAAESKRRLTSYVFHEVRVPLNTALLAVQNMAAAGVFGRGAAEDIEVKALEGSLSMMSKVLNDVLDFNRMDSGRFESVSKPYALHQVMRALCIPLRMATDARRLELVTDLDPAIDAAARRAAADALGADDEDDGGGAEEPGMVVGDEMRLRQIVNNLASNACKFTPLGGRVSICTRLLWPTRLPDRYRASPGAGTPASGATSGRGGTPPGTAAQNSPSSTEASDPEKAEREEIHDILSANHLDQHNLRHEKAPALEKIVVRIEVSDTGCGIQSHDMARNKLFSAFNQTEQGRQQGGKGTGLGLALVRQIVKRSGGRLGVTSAGANQGSTFWVELPLGVGAKAVVGGADRLHRLQHPGGLDPREIDTALADLNPTRVGRELQQRRAARGPSAPAAASAPPTVPIPTPPAPPPMARATMHSIMDQRGRLLSLPSRPGEESNPIFARMAISGPLPSPDAEHAPPAAVAAPAPEDGGAPATLASARGKAPGTIRLPPAGLPEPRAKTDTPTPSTISVPATPAGEPLHPAPGPGPASPRSAAVAAVPARAPPFAGLPVLVVDDDGLTRMLMKRMLTRLGCRVSTAENGEVALDLLTGLGARRTPQSEDGPSLPDRSAPSEDGGHWMDEQRYAIVFLDNQMPVMSGLEVVTNLRESNRRDFVVGVTGNALLSDQEEYLQAGADYVLTKPVLEKSLKGMLSLAEQRRSKRPTFAKDVADGS